MNPSPNARLSGLSPGKRALLERRLLERGPRVSASIAGRAGTGPVPLSFAQQRLWFVDQLDPKRRVNNVARAMRLLGPLNVPALRTALQTIVDRHEALRTTFPVLKDHGQPMQVVRDRATLDLPILDVASEDALSPLLESEANRPFDLASDLPVRGRLLRLGTADHILQLTFHHIASDGWSAAILDRELSAAYAACLEGVSPDLPPVPIQYRDFSEWQHELVRQGGLDEQMAYWREQLEGAVPAVRLGAHRRRPAVQTFSGARERFTIPSAIVNELQALSRRHRATLFMTLLAGFQALLARHADQTDIVVGTPVAGRARTETESLIGCFVNSLVLRVPVEGAASFAEHLERVRQVVLGALSHQDLPFDRLVQGLRPTRDPSRSPVFQVMFALQNAPPGDLQLPDLRIVDVPIETHAARLDLTLVLQERSDELSGFAEYNTDVLDRDEVARLLEQYVRLLGTIAVDPQRRLSTISLLGDADRQRIVEDWNRSGQGISVDATIDAVFEEQVLRTPGATAVRVGNATITYQDLDRRANQVAHALRRRGIGPDSVVGVSMDRSIEMIVGLLAILKAGAGYVPLSREYPRERLAFIVRDTAASLVLTPANWATLLDGSESSERPAAAAGTPERPAYVMYTSGSTGEPKGVVVPHRAVTGLVLHANYVQLGPDDRVAFASDFAFDAATFEIWGALLNGAQLIVLEKHTVVSPSELAASLDTHQITTLFLTTAAFNLCARERPGSFRRLRQLLFGGEAVDATAVRAVLNNDPPGRLLHVYGPTETTTFATWHEVRQLSEQADTVPIGRPVGGTSVYVLDQHRQPVPVGVTGELYIGGDRLALGYLNQPQLTAERFGAEPFSGRSGARMYRTGDLVRWTPAGELVFVGRDDDQVKIRGFRVEPGEIEVALRSHPDVRETTIVTRADAVGTRQLVAYVVPRAQPGPSAASLRSFLAGRLPEYMLPAAYVLVEAMPLRPNGKVDAERLPPVPTTRPNLHPVFVAPRTRLERELQSIWSSVLGVDQVGIDDNFFELGGHSLLAAEMFSTIESVLHVRLPIASLFPVPTIQRQAELIETSACAAAPAGRSLVPIQPLGSKPPFVCVHGIDGEVVRFEALARHMGLDQPFYAVRAYGLEDDASEPLRQVEALAAQYVDDLCAAFGGPYLLAGFSSGATFAFEMARQLVERGQQVGLLVLLDGAAPLASARPLERFARAVRYLGPDLRRYAAYSMEPDQRLALVRFKLAAVRRSVERWRRRRATAAAEAGMSAEVLEAVAEFSPRHLVVARAHYEALSRYAPRPYQGRVLLVRGDIRRLWSLHDRTLGWDLFARGGVDVVDCHAHHDRLLKEPAVQTLAATLNAAIAEATSSPRE